LWFSYYSPETGRLSIPVELCAKTKNFSDGPLNLFCVEPERKWKITFKGKMLDENGRELETELNAAAISEIPVYHFTNDANPAPMARAIASEKWDRNFFNTLKKMHQDHYEQGGSLIGSIFIGGVEHKLNMKMLRDHSFGLRTWSAMERHIWLSVCLDSGEYANLSIPEYPFIKLKAGFISSPIRRSSVIGSSEFTDISGGGIPPSKFDFFIKPDDGRSLYGTCSKGPGFSWLMGKTYRVHEWISEYTLNGIKGKGICEFGYNSEKFKY
jgi:hypothetical protein